ncbi:MAG TPA: hypothetical protein VLZ33_05140 [Dysgonamonadaceae bacterium]|nr:hypothetical protein [Dysgonamonadaceae bacterium]
MKFPLHSLFILLRLESFQHGDYDMKEELVMFQYGNDNNKVQLLKFPHGNWY